MKTPHLVRLVLAVVIGGTTFATAADEAPKKPVRLAWFPRFSPDSKWLITAHGSWEEREGGEVRVWNAETGDEKFVINHERGVRTVAWSPKGKFFAAGDYGNVLRLYDAATGKMIDETKYSGGVEVILITPDEKRVVTMHGGGAVRVTEFPSKKRVRDFGQIQKGGIWGAALSPDGVTVATAGKDGFVRILDLENTRVLHELIHPGPTNGVAFTRDGRYLFTGCQDSAIRVFDVTEGKEVRMLTAHTEGSVSDLQVAPNGKLLASAGMDRTVRLWDLTEFDRPMLKSTIEAHTQLAFGVAISPDGKYLASAGWDDRVNVWKLDTEEEVWTWTR